MTKNCVCTIWTAPKGYWGKFENGTAENITRFAQCILDWTNQCKSPLPYVAKAARLQTATTEKCFVNWAGLC